MSGITFYVVVTFYGVTHRHTLTLDKWDPMTPTMGKTINTTIDLINLHMQVKIIQIIIIQLIKFETEQKCF